MPSNIDARIAEVITKGLRTTLIHPGKSAEGQPSIAIPVPAFRTGSMPPEMAEQVDNMAQLISEAIVHLINTDGNAVLVDKAELDELTGDNIPQPPPDTVMLYCRCQQPVARVNVKDRVAVLDPKLLAANLEAHTCRT